MIVSTARTTVFSDADLQSFYNRDNVSLNADLKLERTQRDNLNSYYPDRNTATLPRGPAMGSTMFASTANKVGP